MAKFSQITTLPDGPNNQPAVFALDLDGRVWFYMIAEGGMKWKLTNMPEDPSC